MKSKSAKSIRKLKKSHTWIWLIVFTLLVLLSGLLTAFFITVYSANFVNEKLDSERSAVQDMVRVYESCVKEGKDPTSVLDAFDREYLILDADRKITNTDSAGTCDITKSITPKAHFITIFINTYIFNASVYSDKLTPVVLEYDGEVIIDLIGILEHTDPYVLPSERKILSSADVEDLEELDFLSELEEKMVKVPLWIGIKTSDGQTEIVAKSFITAEIADLLWLLILFVSIAVLLLIIYIVMIINILAGITRRRKTLRVFFTDAVTQGYNFLFFVYKGEEQLKKYRNQHTRYYVINLVFVGYRNFCVCHSMEEGERVVDLIYKKIQPFLNKKKEICTHVAEADFALLLTADDDETVSARVSSIIEAVSNVIEDHVFAFQAGIVTVLPAGSRDGNGKIVSRKNLELGEVYSLACTARDSLADTDDTGIAFFDEKFVEDRLWTETVQDHQRSALENEEFVVYYQPKYDPRTDELLGAEALIRWQSPDLGFVPPGRMIPIFEKNGFITEIDHYMITHVARDQKRWYDSGHRCVPVSVNVSRSHFIESDLAEQIRDAVDAEGTPHELIEIELTESAFFDDKKAMINTIERLKSYGFAVSMDDFGSGYSSLNSLKDMPLDVLKLDAEFFRGENGGGRGEIVVSEAIKLAKSLDMRTVAEGVEILEQVEFLASQGCDMIQGYFYAKPMPAADYEVRMNERFKPKGE